MAILKIVTFKMGDEEFGLDIQHIQSIERIQPITRVPNAPKYVSGVINLRGNVIPIINLRSKLNLVSAAYTEETRVIFTKNEDIEIGLIVDRTSDVVDVSPEWIEAASSCGFESDYFDDIAKINGRLIILLKLADLMKAQAS